MFEDNEALIYILVGAFVWAIVLYFIITGAVSAGIKRSNYYQRLLFRLMVKKMRKEGFTSQQLKDIHNYSDEEFWKSLDE